MSPFLIQVENLMKLVLDDPEKSRRILSNLQKMFADGGIDQPDAFKRLLVPYS